MRVSDQGPRRAILGQLPRMYRADGSPIRVLLVDDERALTNLVRMALRYEGWEIDVAHDARGQVPREYAGHHRARHHAAGHGRPWCAAADPRLRHLYADAFPDRTRLGDRSGHRD